MREIFNEITGRCKDTLYAEQDAGKETKIILITSASGGVGKTSVAFGLCRCLERNYKKTLYVNADRLQSFQWMLENGEPIRDASVYAGLSGNLGNVYRIVRHVIRKEGFSYLPPFKAALMSLGIPYRVFALLAEKEFERAEAIRGYIEKRNGECTEVARKIPLIPPVLSMNYMAQQFGNMMRGHFDLAAGLNYEDVMPYMLRMSSIGVLAVVGREGSGRYNWIKYVADMLELMYPGRSKVYISDGIGKKLASMKEKRNVVRYSMIAEDTLCN